MERRRKLIMAVAILAVMTAGWAGVAQALDAPKWVASVYVEATKMVGLKWLPVPGATGYKVLRSGKSKADYKEIASVPAPQYMDKEVEPGSTYFYALQAVDAAGPGPNSDEKTITIPGQKKKEMMPPELTKVISQGTTEFGKTTFRVGVFWKAAPDAIAYNLYKSAVQGKDYQLLTSASETQYTDTAVEVGKTYYYVVTALDGSFQETKYSEEKSVVIVEEKVEKKKKKVKLVVASRKSKLLWAKARGDDNGNFAFWEPTDVEINESLGLLYAPSNNTYEIYVLKMASGELVKKIGQSGNEPGQFLSPLGIGLDAAGDLYVVDQRKRTIEVFSPQGEFRRQIIPVPPPEPKLEKIPFFCDVLLDKDGTIFLSDSANSRIWVLDSKGQCERFVGEPGNNPQGLTGPQYLRFNPAGNLTVTSAVTNRVTTYSKDGKFILSFGPERSGVGGFTFIGGYDFDKEGNICVLDKATSMLQGFITRDARYLFTMANEKGDGGAPLYTPKAVAIDSQNRVFVVEGLADRIQAFQLLEGPPEPQELPLEP